MVVEDDEVDDGGSDGGGGGDMIEKTAKYKNTDLIKVKIIEIL